MALKFKVVYTSTEMTVQRIAFYELSSNEFFWGCTISSKFLLQQEMIHLVHHFH